MKLTEKQYYQLKVPGSLKWSSAVFGIACIVTGIFTFLFGFGIFFLVIGILILAIRKWGLALAGTAGMLLVFGICLAVSIWAFQVDDMIYNTAIPLAICAAISLVATILGFKATNDLDKCHKIYLRELEKELDSGNGESV